MYCYFERQKFCPLKKIFLVDASTAGKARDGEKQKASCNYHEKI